MIIYIYIYIYEVEWLINDGNGEHFKCSGRFPREGPRRENPVITTNADTDNVEGKTLLSVYLCSM